MPPTRSSSVSGTTRPPKVREWGEKDRVSRKSPRGFEYEEKVRHTLDGRLCRAVGCGRRVRMRSQDGHGESRRCQAGQEAGRETAARVGKETARRAEERLADVSSASRAFQHASACGLRWSAFQHFVWGAGRPAYGV